MTVDEDNEFDGREFLPERQDLVGRLMNWKFTQAVEHARTLGLHASHAALFEDIETLSEAWGNTGWPVGGVIGEVVRMAVNNVLDRLSVSR